MSKEGFHSFLFCPPKCSILANKQNQRWIHEKERSRWWRKRDLRSSVNHSGTPTRPPVQKRARYSWLHRCRAQRIYRIFFASDYRELLVGRPELTNDKRRASGPRQSVFFSHRRFGKKDRQSSIPDGRNFMTRGAGTPHIPEQMESNYAFRLPASGQQGRAQQ